ncbi:MAG: hypothetical protein ACR2PL_08340 [Dehalococcoidia bacterium]
MTSESEPPLNLLCQFPGDTTVQSAVQDVQNFFRSSFAGVDGFFREQSFGAINLIGTQTKGWYTLPKSLATDQASSGALNQLAEDCAGAAQAQDSTIRPSNFTMTNFWFGESVGQPTGGYVNGTIDGVM